MIYFIISLILWFILFFIAFEINWKVWLVTENLILRILSILIMTVFDVFIAFGILRLLFCLQGYLK